MYDYDQEYQKENDLFGEPYSVFKEFVSKNHHENGKALDLGCGQGRDTFMLAKYGYDVTGVDHSKVGIDQMLEKAKKLNLDVKGIVDDLFTYSTDEKFDVIVLDSIVHFEKADKEKELSLLSRLISNLKKGGYYYIFTGQEKEKTDNLDLWLESEKDNFKKLKSEHLDYTYEEKSTGFKMDFQMYMLILEKII